MKKLFAALLLLPLAQSTAFGPAAQAAQAPAGVQGGGGNAAALTGNVANGKMYWDSNLTACKNCHGMAGEGGFGPDLAGRGLNTAQVLRAVRQPWGIMPAFVESQLSEKDAADLAAYFATLPK